MLLPKVLLRPNRPRRTSLASSFVASVPPLDDCIGQAETLKDPAHPETPLRLQFSPQALRSAPLRLLRLLPKEGRLVRGDRVSWR